MNIVQSTFSLFRIQIIPSFNAAGSVLFALIFDYLCTDPVLSTYVQLTEHTVPSGHTEQGTV